VPPVAASHSVLETPLGVVDLRIPPAAAASVQAPEDAALTG
jgi:hypothetical protein